MKKHVQKALVALGLACTMVVTSIAPAASNLTEVRAEETEDLGVNLALDATADAAFNNPYVEGPQGMNDGYLPTSDSGKSWNCWSAPEESYPMKVSLTWGGPQTMTSMRVMWWADGGGVKWPGKAEVEYLADDGVTWVALGEVGVEVGDFNGVNGVWNALNFGEAITTSSLRMSITRGEGYDSVGISEWEVYGNELVEHISGVTVAGKAKVLVGGTETLTASAKPAKLANEATYAWSIKEGAEYLAIEGDANQSEVTVKGLAEGDAVLTVAATRNEITHSTDVTIRVRKEEVKSIDDYVVSTAAGVAPILPDSVVANGIEFDEPTPNYTLKEGGYDFGETFESKLLPVTWEAVDAASYATAGATFTVKGTVEYAGKTHEAKAVVTVKEPATVGASNSSVTFENVHLEDNFWLPKQEVNATTSLNKAILEISKSSGGEPNFDNAIKKLNGEEYKDFSGFVFQDSDIYKSLEAISYTLSATQNETGEEIVAQRKVLEDKLESWIQKIEAVQYADGYIDTFFTLRSPSYSGGGSKGTHRWLNMSNHEMYNAGHFLEAVVAYTRYREGIGKPDYRLYVAGKRFADHIVTVFGPNGYRHEVPGHEEIELAMVKFGKLMEEYEGAGAAQNYYDTVKLLIDRRGSNYDERESGYWAGTYSQDATPFVEETQAVGHAVRANYFYAGVTDIATMLPEDNTDRAAYINSLDTIWNTVTESKTYITGGIGTTAAGSDPEGYGQAYVLPPAQSYCEICAGIASANWNHRMNLLHEDGKYADMVETCLYNAVLVGTNLDGNRFYYSTLLRANNGNQRSEWFGCACCPPNLMRTIAALGGYMYNVHNNDLFVNMYSASTSDVNINGTDVTVKQETNYPWDGDIKITVNPVAEKAFAMKVRIPGWVSEQKNQNVTIKVNGEAVDATATNGYVTIDRTWKAQDTVEITLPMEVRLTESHELVEDTQGQVAIERGPIVYCMEMAGNVDINPEIENFDPMNFVIPRDAELTATYKEDYLRGVVEITGDVKYATGNGAEMVDAKLQAIPYYAWNNRGNDAEYVEDIASPENNSARMLIWTMADSPIVGETNVRDYATPSVSYVGWGMGAENINDGAEGTFWNGHSDPALETGGSQWMMYDFGEKKAELTGSEIMFYDDGGGVVVPNGIVIEYTNDAGEWVEVTPVGEWTMIANEFATYEFEKIVTSQIRVTMEHNNQIAVAVNEWKLIGDLAGASSAATMTFGFDGELGEGVNAIVTGLGAYDGEVVYGEGRTGEETDKAIKTGDYGIELPVKNLGTDYIVDFWAKADGTILENSPVIALGYHNPEKWLAIAGNNGTNECKVWTRDPAVDAFNGWITVGTMTVPTEWSHIVVAQSGTKVSVYQNDELVVSGEATEALNNENGGILLGVNNWDAEFTGLIDDVTVSKIDRTTLNATIEAAKAKVEADYTTDSFKALTDALAAAVEVNEKLISAQDALDAANSELAAAIEGLVEAADKAVLTAEIEKAAAKVEKDYTADSWKVFADALAAAKAVVEDGNATQKAVDDAKLALTKAIEGLTAPKEETKPEPKPEEPKIKVGDEVTVSGVKYSVTDVTNATVAAVGPEKKTAKKITIKDTVTINGVECKVTSIKANAFKKMSKLTSVTIPKNVTEIGKSAFQNCKKLKTVKIKSTTVTSIGKNAFKGIYKKAKIDVPNNKKVKKAYTTMLKSAKTAKTVKIK